MIWGLLRQLWGAATATPLPLRGTWAGGALTRATWQGGPRTTAGWQGGPFTRSTWSG